MSRYKLCSEVLQANLEEGDVLFNPSSGQYHLLNPSARLILTLMESGSTLKEAGRELAKQEGIAEQLAITDSEGFIQGMLDRGLVEEAH